MRVLLGLLVVSLVGCHANLTLPKPMDPKHIAISSSNNPRIDAVLRIDDFVLGKIQSNISAHDMQQFREYTPTLIGNNIYASLAPGMFRAVKRTMAGPSADYVVSGTYDLYMYVGTKGREWIPFAGTFGARIQEATVKETLHVVVKEARSGQVLLDQDFEEEQEEWNSIYSPAQATWLQPNLMGKVVTAIVQAIEGSGRTSTYTATPPVTNTVESKVSPVPSKYASADQGGGQLIESINGRVPNIQFFTDDEIDPSRTSDFMDRCTSSSPQSTFDQRSTRYVWFCAFIVPDGRFKKSSPHFTIALRRAADNSLVTWFPGITLELDPTAPYGMLLNGYGATDPGKIEAGAYRLEVYTNNQVVGTGSFEVR